MRSAQVEAARAGSMEDPQEKEGATERLQLKRATLEAKRDWATAYFPAKGENARHRHKNVAVHGATAHLEGVLWVLTTRRNALFADSAHDSNRSRRARCPAAGNQTQKGTDSPRGPPA